MYSSESLERQWEQALEVLLAMEGRCDELVIDCLQGLLGEQGCQVTVRRREDILSLLHELNRLYDSGVPCRELIHEEDNEGNEDDDRRFSWVYEFDFFLRESDFLLHFVIDATLNSDGIINGYLALERQVYREGVHLDVSEPVALDREDMERLKEKVAAMMAIPPNTGRFLDWKDVYPGVDE